MHSSKLDFSIQKICSYCKKIGYSIADCRKLKYNNQKKLQEQNKQSEKSEKIEKSYDKNLNSNKYA